MIVFCVSGHGFGHASRVAAALAALRARMGDQIEIHVRTDAPAEILSRRDPLARVVRADQGPGIVQRGGLDLDRDATLRAHEAHLAQWSDAVDREATAFADLRADLVVGDIPPLAFEAAARVGVPALALANFSWDWMLSLYERDEPRFAAIARHYRRAYAHAESLLRLPFHAGLAAFRHCRDVPLLVHRARHTAEVRRALDLDRDGRTAVLVSFGGHEAPLTSPLAPDFVLVDARAAAEEHPHEELVAACDVLLGKPGYGTVAEAVAHRCRFLYVPRPDYREIDCFSPSLRRGGWARELPRRDFESGRWQPHIARLRSEASRFPELALDGADVVAQHILERLGTLAGC